ncbi:uncharacterized protein F5Z01DRAFT_715872 [Emericellopsis atlantica]|uniref:Uncharacterized protein n=1 Tax=Emericellopsis atlantica TaxID=2614577 RepID=A0A9P7ZCM6_9HYPO|nr:uncharacterized protein F5Z01DRAFT_715872 [Emericellopsis atlantica]KAG9249520.1 hypothetical protein F5Z01DRAFT_715872 [Emericellopsis atlantica]
MAATNNRTSLSSTRSGSPSPDTLPTPAIGAVSDLSRYSSTTSSLSNTSSAADATSRDSSMHSDLATPRNGSRPPPRQNSHGHDVKRRRGYMRPQATDFAASAKSRESVMSLGSIAHLQYYFARTGLLDGKGGQLARKKSKHPATLDLSALEASGSELGGPGTDPDSSYGSVDSSSPDVGAHPYSNRSLTESPTDEDDDSFSDSFAESESGMLPPTVSTYNHKEKVVPKPPTIVELKAELDTTLAEAAKAIKEVQHRKEGTYVEPADAPRLPNMPDENTQGWFELQGMQILDVVTLAIRAAKMYYTAHEMPDRLDAIKSEKQVRADLLVVMEVLKQQATRHFKGGMKDDEVKTINGWIESVYDILRKEAEIEAAEKAERASWTWLDGDWTGREYERERAFLSSMDPEAASLPAWTPVSDAAQVPTPFLAAFQNGLRLVKLHNAAVHKSRRRFGAIPTFHTDTQKPYRCADNLRYWVKAAELRFEIHLRVDVMGVVNNSGPEAWQTFEAAILQWCRHVREELARELAR